MTPFKDDLKTGQLGESIIARWLRSRGNYVLPAYQVEIHHGKGPRVFTPDGKLIAPDMLAFCREKLIWVEAKHKTRFTWYRRKQRWETGIDVRHWHDYLKVREQLDLEVWLMFLHRSGEPSENDRQYLPPNVTECPTGLFGIEIAKAQWCGRYSGEHARGMMYWGHEDLKQLATLEEVSS